MRAEAVEAAATDAADGDATASQSFGGRQAGVSEECRAALSRYWHAAMASSKGDVLRCMWSSVWPAEWMLFADTACPRSGSGGGSTVHGSGSTNNAVGNDTRGRKGGSSRASKEGGHRDGTPITRNGTASGGAGLLLLPVVQERLANVRKILQALPHPPILVTIARSSDYWTPISLVGHLEATVLEMLADIFPIETDGEVLPGQPMPQPARACAGHADGTSTAANLLGAAQLCLQSNAL